MRLLILAAASLALAGCSPTLTTFFGTSDPCGQAAVFHAGFQTAAAIEPKVARFAKAERAAYAAISAQCADGEIGKVTLVKTLNAYAAALGEWKSGQPADPADVAVILAKTE
jgi:hypothetical protein